VRVLAPSSHPPAQASGGGGLKIAPRCRHGSVGAAPAHQSDAGELGPLHQVSVGRTSSLSGAVYSLSFLFFFLFLFLLRVARGELSVGIVEDAGAWAIGTGRTRLRGQYPRGLRQPGGLARSPPHPAHSCCSLDEPTSGLEPAVPSCARAHRLPAGTRGRHLPSRTHRLDERAPLRRVAVLKTTLASWPTAELRGRLFLGSARGRLGEAVPTPSESSARSPGLRAGSPARAGLLHLQTAEPRRWPRRSSGRWGRKAESSASRRASYSLEDVNLELVARPDERGLGIDRRSTELPAQQAHSRHEVRSGPAAFLFVAAGRRSATPGHASPTLIRRSSASATVPAHPSRLPAQHQSPAYQLIGEGRRERWSRSSDARHRRARCASARA